MVRQAYCAPGQPTIIVQQRRWCISCFCCREHLDHKYFNCNSHLFCCSLSIYSFLQQGGQFGDFICDQHLVIILILKGKRLWYFSKKNVIHKQCQSYHNIIFYALYTQSRCDSFYHCTIFLRISASTNYVSFLVLDISQNHIDSIGTKIIKNTHYINYDNNYKINMLKGGCSAQVQKVFYFLGTR